MGGDETENTSASAGAVYLFARSDNAWRQVAYVKASNSGEGDSFGFAVAVSRRLLVIGAPQDDSSETGLGGDGQNDLSVGSGAAYVFE